MSRTEWKQAFISLVIGTLISAVTIFLQGLIELLQSVPTGAPGPVAGMAYYLVKVRFAVFT